MWLNCFLYQRYSKVLACYALFCWGFKNSELSNLKFNASVLIYLFPPFPAGSFPSCQKGKEGSCHTEKKRIICWLKILHVSTNPECLSSAKLFETPQNGCVCVAIFRSNPSWSSAGGFIPFVPKLTNGTQGQRPARVWADPIRVKYSRGGSEVARGHEEEEGEKEEVKQKPSQTLRMERNRILRSLVGICPEKLSYYYYDFFV